MKRHEWLMDHHEKDGAHEHQSGEPVVSVETRAMFLWFRHAEAK